MALLSLTRSQTGSYQDAEKVPQGTLSARRVRYATRFDFDESITCVIDWWEVHPCTAQSGCWNHSSSTLVTPRTRQLRRSKLFSASSGATQQSKRPAIT